MRKKILSLCLATAMVAGCMTGCGSTDSTSSDDTSATGTAGTASNSDSETPAASGEKEDVTLTVWGAEEDQTMLQEMIDSFTEENADVANWNISLGAQSESTAKDTVLADVEAAADVYAFADDQLNELVAAGALQAVTLDTDAIIEANGGADSGSVQAASMDGTLYAYPMTADNGYFMFYNSEYFTEEDVQSLDTMLEVAAAANKKVSMTVDDGWYIYSFFQGAGLTLSLNDDGVTNTCTWNATDGTYTGVDVAEAILAITSNAGFQDNQDADFVSGVKDGTIIAGVSGTWNAEVAQETWGDNYAATKLPTYTLAGDQVQMASFSGYKLIGVNPNSQYAGYAMMLAEYLTNYDNQVKRFEMRGLGPSNVDAAASDAVQTDPAISALALQSQYATVQRVGGNYWDPAATLGAILVGGNADGTDLQTLLDNAVEGIQAPVAE
jgi:arabinogalactan oligomer/maltooligosaccharide transport system substrate-binding protein